MSNPNFVEIGSARLSRTGKALEISLYLFRCRMFIDLDRLKGIEKGEVNDAPIWILREDKHKLKEKSLHRR